MMLKATSMGAVLLVSLAAGALAAPTLRDKQQAACYDDVQTLCGDLIPDEDQIEACMKAKRAKISKGCAKMFDMVPPPG